MKYPLSMRLLHAIMAVIILSLLGVGLYMTSLTDSVSYKYDLYFWHKSFGLTVILLVCVRVWVRLRSTIPAAPQGIPQWQKKLAVLTQGLLYVFMFFVPVMGYLLSSTYPKSHGVSFFGLAIPDLTAKSEFWSEIFGELHEVGAYLLLALIALHVLGALKHRFWDKPENNVLNRIW